MLHLSCVCIWFTSSTTSYIIGWCWCYLCIFLIIHCTSSPNYCRNIPVSPKFLVMPAGYQWGNSRSAITVLPSTAVFCHGSYHGAHSVIPPNTVVWWQQLLSCNGRTDCCLSHRVCMCVNEYILPTRRSLWWHHVTLTCSVVCWMLLDCILYCVSQ